LKNAGRILLTYFLVLVMELYSVNLKARKKLRKKGVKFIIPFLKLNNMKKFLIMGGNFNLGKML